MLLRRSLSCLCLALPFVTGCGGSNKPAEAAAPNAESHGEGARRAPTPASEEDETTAPAPAHAICENETCTPCGDAICPNGWYCDESARGGPACGWLPECAQKASCGCVKKTFAGCSCEDEHGAAHLSCR
jgi:hypothetical protein